MIIDQRARSITTSSSYYAQSYTSHASTSAVVVYGPEESVYDLGTGSGGTTSVTTVSAEAGAKAESKEESKEAKESEKEKELTFDDVLNNL